MKEYVSESQNIVSWVMEHESIDKNKICIGGISFGSIVSELILELRDDIQCGVFLLGGADLETLFLKSKIFKNITVEMMKNNEISKEIFDTIKFLDPITYAYKLKK